MTTKTALFCIAVLAASLCLPAQASAPVGPTTTKTVKLDGVALSAPPQSGRVLAPTFQYDVATKVLHMWVLMSGAPGESLTNIRHAVSTDGLNFTSTGNLSYAGSPWTGTPWGTQTGEPAMIYPKVALWNGRYKLLLWTYNAQSGQGPWGDYNYNISVNDIGLDLNNLVVEHEGPIGPIAGGIPGQNAGAWGVVNDINYFENNFFVGRSDVSELPLGTPLTPPSTASTGPYRLNGSAAQVLDQVHTLPAPFALALNCFDTPPPGTPSFYVHNDARVLANPDATLGIIYSIRDCATGARVAPQLFYAESADNGLTWVAPVGIFSGAAVNVDGVPTTGNFALADFFVAEGLRYVYISTTDALGNVVVAGAGLALPAVLQSAASRRVHGTAGTFDLALPLTPLNPGTEPRQGTSQNLVFTFDKPITGATVTVTEGTATAAAPTFSGNQVIVALSGVTDIQYVTVTLSSVASADGGTGGSGSVRVGFLVGDVNQNRVVTVSDLGAVNAQQTFPVTAANFLTDVNANGVITVADRSITNSALTHALP